jgi:hypothetical protein
MQLRKALPGEEPALLEIAAQEPLFNLFLTTNLRTGIGDMIEAWVQDGVGVLLRRAANWILYPGPAPEQFDFDGAAAIMDAYPAELVSGMTGHPSSVDPLLACLKVHVPLVHAEHFAALDGEPRAITYSGTPRPARPEDLDQAVAIYADAEDMSRPAAAVERMLPTLWVVEDGGRITSVGNIHAETEYAAIIGAVYTPVPFRGKGYASTLVHGMSSRIVSDGKTACLFFHNPVAGRIYLGLGYKELGPWRLARFGT